MTGSEVCIKDVSGGYSCFSLEQRNLKGSRCRCRARTLFLSPLEEEIAPMSRR
jgi:hypothetical protein